MSFDDRKKKGEKPTYSSPDAFKQDHHNEREELKKKIEKKDDTKGKELDTLKADIEKQKENSRATKDRKKEVAEAHERDEDAGSFSEKMQEREEERQSAMNQGGSEEPTKGIG